MDWNRLNPIPFLKESSISLLSDGKWSIKRFISLICTICLVYMVWYLLHNIVPDANKDLFHHCFDVLAGLIILLTGAATIKDIIALKNGTKETTQIDTPDTTITKVTEIPTGQS